jgi:amino acid transporter
MNKYTQTPVNTVIYDAILSLLLGLLVFAGPQAINAIFSLSVVALYIAYAIPIVARFAFNNDFKPGPFNLGIFVRHLRHPALLLLIIDVKFSVHRASLLPPSQCCGCCLWE